MRRFFTISLIVLALAVSAAGVAPAAHAAGTATEGQICDPGDTTEGGSAVCATNLFCDVTTGTCKVNSTETLGPPTSLSAAKIALDKGRTENASWGLNFVVSWIVKLFAWLVGVAALTLNYAMYYTVVGMGAYVSKLSAIGTVWRILRDIGNILLIFGFLAIGISIIIDSEWYGGGQKLLPTLLIVAVFANFSLFAAEAMIDVGNLFATQIYKQISGGSLPELSGGAFGAATDVANERISTMILNKVGLQTIYSNGKVNTEIFEAGNSWLISFMSIILFVITAFVMFSLAFILISRFIVLILLIMVSPVGVAGLAVPGLQGWAKKWWDTLFQQTITAPILLLMLYIALSVITDDAFLTGFGVGKDSTGWIGWAKTVTGTNNFGGLAQMMLSFLIATGLLLAVVYFAKTLSAVGAGWATKTAGKLTFGATGWAGRTSVGWLSTKAARGLRRTPIARIPLAGTGLVKGLEKVGRASFDVRGAKIGGGLKAAGISAGDAQKGGYKADLKARIESRTKYADDLKGRELTDEEKLRQAKAREDIKKLNKTYKEVGAKWAVADDGRNTALRELDEIRRNLTSEEYEARKNAINVSMKDIETELESAKGALDKRQTELQEVESVTDAGAKLKYAKALNLWSDEKNTFNKVFNFAANTEAAKNIRKEAKKSSADKTLDSLKNVLKKIGEEGKPKEEEKPEEKQSESPKSGPSAT